MSGLPIRQVALIVGLLIGLGLGLVYTWGVAPVELVNTYPALLRTDYRWDWVRLAALSYVADGDLEQARVRLNGLKHEDVAGAMEALIEEYAAAGRPADTLRRLTTLAERLDVHTPAMLVYVHTPITWSTASTPTPSRTPAAQPTRTPTSSPEPTATSAPTPKPTGTSTPRAPSGSPTPAVSSQFIFEMEEQEQICQPGLAPHFEVVVQDEDGMGLAGREIWLTWSGGADRAVTGIKPRGGAGYADFGVRPGVTYALAIGELGMPVVTDLHVETCPPEVGDEGLLVLGSWRIVLQRRLSGAE